MCQAFLSHQVEVVAIRRLLDVGGQQVEGALTILRTSQFDANLFHAQLKSIFHKNNRHKHFSLNDEM
jgi:hypothetical protein